MPKKKKTTHSEYSEVESSSSEKNFLNSLVSQAKIGESYTSLILGIIVVVVATILVVTFIKNRTTTPAPTQDTSSMSTEKPLEDVKPEDLPTTYTVVEGDDLWNISEKVYKSGYNWVDIATENKLDNPDVLAVGTKLTLPKVEVKESTAPTEEAMMTQPEDNQMSMEKTENPNAISGTSYTVVEGDILWSIATRAYNDGYKWVEIANANKLANPDHIEVGQKLTLPR